VRNRIVAKRYADALLLNIDEKHFASFRKDIRKLENIFWEHPEFIKSINSLLFPLQKRLDLALEVSHNLQNQKIWSNLFDLLVKKHRFDIIDDILLELEDAILIKDNHVKVQLTIAHEHPEKVMESISAKIKKILKKDIELNIKIDPNIIGGFVAQTESLMIDGSIKNNLAKLMQVKKNIMRSV
jgi:F-type H+-transporting ATPase subunit delta